MSCLLPDPFPGNAINLMFNTRVFQLHYYRVQVKEILVATGKYSSASDFVRVAETICTGRCDRGDTFPSRTFLFGSWLRKISRGKGAPQGHRMSQGTERDVWGSIHHL